MKYIVKNCPAFGKYAYQSCELEFLKCQYNDDCPIKQIIELVKGGNPFLAEKVLEILQVEEVEE